MYRPPVLRGSAPTRPKTAAPADPFAQTSPQQIQQLIQSVTSRLPQPQTPQQIQQQVAAYRQSLPAPLGPAQIRQQAQGMLDPVIQRITQNINALAGRQAQAVGGYTDSVAKALAALAPQAGAPYAQAEQATAASNEALADRLAGGGQAAGADLASRLASINAPGAVDPAVAAAQAAGSGAGNSLYASGNAALQQLAANQAAAQGYANKLPGIARLGGIQQAGLVRGQAASSLADQIAQAEGQLPSILQNLQQLSQSNATNRAQGAQQLRQDLTQAAQTAQGNRASTTGDLLTTLLGQNITKGTAKAGLIGDVTKASQPTYVGSSGTGYYAVDPNTGQPIGQVVAPAPKTPKTPSYKSVAPGSTVIDPQTGRVVYKALAKPKTTSAAKPKTLSANELQTATAAINSGVDHMFSGDVPDPANPGQLLPALGRDGAIAELRKEGYFATPQLAKIAMAAVNRRWPLAHARSTGPFGVQATTTG